MDRVKPTGNPTGVLSHRIDDCHRSFGYCTGAIYAQLSGMDSEYENSQYGGVFSEWTPVGSQ
jgi:hypothetical protein